MQNVPKNAHKYGYNLIKKKKILGFRYLAWKRGISNTEEQYFFDTYTYIGHFASCIEKMSEDMDKNLQIFICGKLTHASTSN